MADDLFKIASYIVIGAVITSAFQSPATAGVFSSLFSGFSGVIGAMTGHPAAQAANTAGQIMQGNGTGALGQ
jgi:hypothetical protein